MDFSTLKNDLEKEKNRLSDMETELRFVIKQLSGFDIDINDLKEKMIEIRTSVSGFEKREMKLESKLNKLLGEK